MATEKTATKTVVKERISEQLRIDNSGNENRKCDVQGVALFEYNKFIRITNGTVKKDGEQRATFEASQGGTVDVRGLIGSTEEKAEIITAIDEFVSNIKDEHSGISL